MKRQIKKIILILAWGFFLIPGLFAQKQHIPDEWLIAKFHQMMGSCQYKQACLIADQLLSKDSLNIEYLILKGRALAADFMAQAAKDLFTRAYMLDTANTITLFDMVNVCKQLGDSKQAIIYCQKIVDQFPENSFFTILLSNLYYGTEDFRKAKDLLFPLYRLDSLNVYVLKQLGNSFNELQQVDSAIHFYRRYLELVPFDPMITGKLTNLYIRKKDFPSGLCLTEVFLDQDSTNTGILKLNAYCNYLMKEYPVSAQKFSKCVMLGDKSKFTLKYSGLSWYKQEKYDLAEPLFRLAYQADTSDAEVCFYYGVSAYRSALLDTGVIYLEKTIKMITPDPEFLNTIYVELAGAYNENGQADTALTILKSAYEDHPTNATLAFKIAYQYDYYLRKPFMALPYYKEFLRICPESEKQEVNLPLQRSYYGFALNRVKEIKGK